MSLGRAVAAFIPSWASFPKKRTEPVQYLAMGLDRSLVTVGDLHGQIVMLYYLLVHFALRTLQSLTSVCLLINTH